MCPWPLAPVTRFGAAAGALAGLVPGVLLGWLTTTALHSLRLLLDAGQQARLPLPPFPTLAPAPPVGMTVDVVRLLGLEATHLLRQRLDAAGPLLFRFLGPVGSPMGLGALPGVPPLAGVAGRRGFTAAARWGGGVGARTPGARRR